MDKLKNMKKTTKNNIITYALVIAAFVIMQSLINAGSISSLLEGLMVPLCIYIIMAVSLNLVVGVLGELSLGHAGFMCVGCIFLRIFRFIICQQNSAQKPLTRLAVLYHHGYCNFRFAILHDIADEAVMCAIRSDLRRTGFDVYVISKIGHAVFTA